MPLSFRLQKHSKALMFLNCASPECEMTRQRFLKWTQPAKSRLRPRLAAPQNQALTSLLRKLSDISHSCVPHYTTGFPNESTLHRQFLPPNHYGANHHRHQQQAGERNDDMRRNAKYVASDSRTGEAHHAVA